jgi:hypothetical protein
MVTTNQVTVYSEVNRCIYCGTDEEKLSKEHIIPYALGGTLVLPKSSCRKCADIINKAEQFCLRTMFGPLRIRLDFPTRRRKERPKTIPLEIITSVGDREQRILSPHEIPLVCIGFSFPIPGILRGLPPSETCNGKLIVRFQDDEVRKYLNNGKIKLGTSNIYDFCRMIAKIAHSYAVASLGYGAFNPMLPDLILGKSKFFQHLVGGDVTTKSQNAQVLHELKLQNCLFNGIEYVLASLQLFSFIGMPWYQIVVGKAL